MEITPFTKYSKTDFSLIGKMCTLNDYQKLRNYFNNLKIKSKFLIIDMSRLTFTGTHGLGTLISISKSTKKQNVKMILYNPKEEINSVIKVTGISMIIKVVNDKKELAEAIKNI